MLSPCVPWGFYLNLLFHMLLFFKKKKKANPWARLEDGTNAPTHPQTCTPDTILQDSNSTDLHFWKSLHFQFNKGRLDLLCSVSGRKMSLKRKTIKKKATDQQTKMKEEGCRVRHTNPYLKRRGLMEHTQLSHHCGNDGLCE